MSVQTEEAPMGLREESSEPNEDVQIDQQKIST